MTKQWKSITLFSTMLCLTVGGSVVTQAATSQRTTSKATTEFKAPDEGKPVDPSDPEDPDPKPIKPTDPTDPNPPVYPGGPLRLNHVPTLSFGINEISAKGATYLAQFEDVIDLADGTNSGKAKASFVEVADETGKLRGWTVTVASDGIFKSSKGTINGIITLKAGDVRGLDGMDGHSAMFPTANDLIVIGGQEISNVAVMTAEAGKGMNKWQVRYGLYANTEAIQKGDDGTERNPHVTLTVPKGQIVLADQTYVADMVWTLSQVF